jgi:hypothetical protein
VDAKPLLARVEGEQLFFERRVVPFQDAVVATLPEVRDWIRTAGISADELRLLAHYLIWAILWNPPAALARTYCDYSHDESFGRNLVAGPWDGLSWIELIYCGVSRRHRRQVRDLLEASGWPQGLLKNSPFGIAYRVARRTRRIWHL